MKKDSVADGVRDFIEKLIELVIGAVFLWMLFVGVYAFVDAHGVTESGKLGDDVKAAAEELKTQSDGKMDGLKAINNEIIGWITINDTQIDQPIMQAKDNTKYLTRDYSGNFSTSGGVFVDYRNNKLEDEYSIIYGHRMKDGLMFSDVTKYVDETYFRAHSTGTVYTETKKYKAEVIGFSVINVASTDIYAIEKLQNNSALAKAAFDRHAMYLSDTEIKAGDKLILLSTCDNDARFKRDVLLLRLVSD